MIPKKKKKKKISFCHTLVVRWVILAHLEIYSAILKSIVS
jgi:hypothetical protein